MDTKNTFRYAWQPYIVTIAVIAVAAAVRLWPLHVLGVRTVWVTFYPAVMVAALYGGLSAGLLGTFLSCLTVLFVLPFFVHQPFIRDSADWLGLAVFFATCTMISGIAEAMRRAQAREKQAEEAVQASEAKFRGLLEGAATPIVGVDSHGLIVLVNAATERLFGYTREELLNRPLETLVPERFREAHGGHRTRYATQPSTRPMGLCMDLFAKRKDGSEIPVEISLSPTETPEGLLVMAIIIDISARKQAEQKLQQRAAELQAVNAELEAFTYSVSHDLRSPLRHIDGFSQLLLKEHSAELSEQARHYLIRVCNGTRQMGQLVDDLLSLSRVGRQELHRQVTGLNSLVEEALRDLKEEVEGRKIEWRIGPLPFVECDTALVKQVFANLLSNAVKFTRPREQAVIEVGAMKQDGVPVIFVRDNGVGFSMKYVEKLFGVFQRLHRPEDFEGTGIGLATVQRIVHKHGGRVWAEAELDNGATFHFTLGTSENSGMAEKTIPGR